MANFEYIDEVEAAAEEARKKEMESKNAVNNSDRANYWEDLLRDKYEGIKLRSLVP